MAMSEQENNEWVLVSKTEFDQPMLVESCMLKARCRIFDFLHKVPIYETIVGIEINSEGVGVFLPRQNTLSLQSLEKLLSTCEKLSLHLVKKAQEIHDRRLIAGDFLEFWKDLKDVQESPYIKHESLS